MNEIVTVSINDLEFWGENPRFGLTRKHDTPEKAIKALFDKSKDKMLKLAEDMVDFGLVLNDLPVIYKLESGKYKVYEGNRRVANIFCITKPEYLSFDSTLKEKYSKMNRDKIPEKITCLLSDDLEYVYGVIRRLHDNENGGIARASWGTSEKQLFIDLYNKTFNKDSDDNNEKLKPHYLLLREYPLTFTHLVEKIKPTNVDRILDKEVIKKALKTSDYLELSPNQMKIIEKLLNHVFEQGEKAKGGISRLYNEPEIKNELVPLIEEYESELNVIVKGAPDLSLLGSDLLIYEGETKDLSKMVSNYDDFESVSFESENLEFSTESIVSSNNEPGSYNIYVKGFFDKKEVSSKLISMKIMKKNRSKATSVANKNLFKHDFSSKFKIDFGSSINSFIDQVNMLNTRKYSYIANVCLRIVLEEACKIFVANKSLGSTGLENNLKEIKSYFTAAQITSLDRKSGLGFNKVQTIINNLNPVTFSKEVHPLAHNIVTIDHKQLENLGIRVSNILVILSEEIK